MPLICVENYRNFELNILKIFTYILYPLIFIYLQISIIYPWIFIYISVDIIYPWICSSYHPTMRMLAVIEYETEVKPEVEYFY